MKNLKIHQFTPTVSYGDGVSNGLLFTQEILAKLGFDSKIYVAAYHVDLNFKHEVHHIDSYIEDKDNILLYHYSIGHDYHYKIMKFKDKKILVYHNITPSHFFSKNTILKKLCDEGREQIEDSVSYFISAYCDSLYSVQELKMYGYKNPQFLPMLKPSNTISQIKLPKKFSSSFNILFVGRVVTNKCQHQLLDVVYYLKNNFSQDVKLYLVGKIAQDDYFDFLKSYRKHLCLEDDVVFANGVTDEELQNYFEKADIYLSLSEHEGFGIPLLEAMQYDIPVLAYEAGGVSSVLGERYLLRFKSADYVAKRVLEIKDSAYMRYDMILYQKKSLSAFSYEELADRFTTYLGSLDIDVPKTQKQKKLPSLNYLLEGPFDSNYSLSIVNRNLARAIGKEGVEVKLHSTEGHGDFQPDIEFLDKNPDIKEIYLKKMQSVDISIRNLYPPRTDSMLGYHKIVGPYGWEESAFPLEYVDGFNSRLSMVFTMSSYVKKVMIQNGVKIPLFTTGVGVDHLLSYGVKEPPYKLPDGFRFLHISSCFPRKGVDLLLEVFDEISHLDISLIIKTFPNPHNDIEERIQRLSQKTREKILLINEDLTPSQINYLYANCDALVAPSRGEGFGLPMAEAMLFNLPVITTAYGGQMDFCSSDNSWLIDYSFKRAKTHFNLFDSYWVEPSKESLKKSMLDIISTPKDEIKKKTIKAKKRIISNYKWSDISKKILNTIDKYQPSPSAKIKLAWISTYNSRCGIASYSHSLIKSIKDEFDSICIFADKGSEILKKQEEKFVKRVWRDRFEEDNGELIMDLKRYNPTHIVIEFNFAFFSIKNLEDIIKNSSDKKIFLELHSVKDVTIKGLEASLGDIADTLNTIEQIIVHNIEDLNILKSFGIVKNTTLLPLGVEKLKETRVDNFRFTIGTFGFLLPHKGIFELIELFYHLKKSMPQATLLLLTSLYPSLASQDYYLKCQKKIEEFGLEESVTFVTDYLLREEIQNYLSSVELIVLLYKETQESASASIREALLSKRPILVGKQNIFNDVLDTIHSTKDKNPKEVAREVETLLSDKKRLYLKEDMQTRWLHEHDFEVIGKKFINILKGYANWED